MKLSARRREVGDALAPTSRFSWLGINRRQIDRAVDSCVRSQLTPEEDILRHELEQARKVNARLAQDAADLSDKLNWMRYLAHRAAEGMPLTAAHDAESCLAELIAETEERARRFDVVLAPSRSSPRISPLISARRVSISSESSRIRSA